MKCFKISFGHTTSDDQLFVELWDVTDDSLELITAFPITNDRIHVDAIKKIKELINLGYSMSIR